MSSPQYFGVRLTAAAGKFAKILAKSARYGVELNLPGLRSWPRRSFPHLVFYFEMKDCIDVWRVLPGTRDIR